MPYVLNRALVPLTLFLLLGTQILLNRELRFRDVAFVMPGEVTHKSWNPKLFEIASFGHLPVLVDWIWIQALLDPAMSRLPRGTHSGQFYRFDLITDLDPANYIAYYAGSTMISIVRDDAIGALALLKKADRFQKEKLAGYPEEFRARRWAGAWFLQLVAGYVHLFELDDIRSAALSFKDAASLPGAPEYVLRLGERLTQEGGEYEVGLKLLNFMIGGATDERARARLEKKRQSLFIAQHVSELNRGFRRFLSQNSKYKTDSEISPAEMQSYWVKFRKAESLSLKDPWGGTFSLDDHGRIVTTTRYDRVFGID